MNSIDSLATPENSPFFPKLSERILHRHLTEGWKGLINRIVDAANQAEELYSEKDKEAYLIEIRQVLEASEFLPNSPLMVNISEKKRKIFACYSLDARKPIDDFLQVARQVHDGMGGIGYSLEHIKESSKIQNFIKVFDEDTVNHQAGRPRPASNAVTISIENPGMKAILDEAGHTKVTNLNIGISETFMEKYNSKDPWALERLRMVAESVHKTGQPAILFVDKIPNVSLEEDTPFAANVCGESPLAADESGLLGSINLVKFLKQTRNGYSFDEEKFACVVKTGVRFLDGMHDIHDHASPQLQRNTLSTRKIGIGLMGYAHLLALLGIRYGSMESVQIAEKISKLLMDAANEESSRLSEKRGSYPALHPKDSYKKRNALLVAIAQTSTLSLLVHTSSGIEPINGYVTKQNIMNDEMFILDPVIAHYAVMKELDPEKVKNDLINGKELYDIFGYEIAELFPKALEIKPEEHIEVQAAFQKHIDGGISKTINCSFSTTVEDIESWINLAYKKGLLGFMIYRDKSLLSQPIEVMN
ncbi:ribonucleoside-diphosphate reductase alpha chain [Bacillus tianshenii]|uniref:Ribonucleoside-diphosphate reductase alpha chain n=1 Tax=Sutcliffiella tianshenii TaxID=1463404 RepID=A0ABS2NZD6_9BACI|nr:hypothetical protein [Bacillus tianshenii]MBM7620067.1 ribonucleoside-diphosphate reductase alpha chain [Bacillus tianshenii]